MRVNKQYRLYEAGIHQIASRKHFERKLRGFSQLLQFLHSIPC